MNKVILMGRLTRDPEIRYSQNNSSLAIARYSLAVDRRFRRSQQGEMDNQQTADFFRCVAFDKSAEFAEKYFHQGMRVLVEGRLQTGSYVNKDGQKVNTVDVIVENQEFADGKSSGSGGGNFNNNINNYNGYNNNNGNYDAPSNPVGSRNMDFDSTIGDGFMNIPDGVEDEGLPFN